MDSLPFVRIIVLTVSFILAPHCAPALAADVQRQAEQLKLITAAADQICAAVPVNGSITEAEASGKVKAEVNSLLKRFADVGGEVGGKYRNTQSQGLLQKDVVEALRDSNSCKLTVLVKLQDKLLSGEPGAQPAQPHHQGKQFELAKFINTGASRIAGHLNVAISVRSLPGADVSPFEEAIQRAFDERGYSVISVFRPEFQRAGLAQQLFDGDATLATQLRLRQYCDAVVLGVLRLAGPAQQVGGMYIREAVLDVREVDPLSGHVGPALEIREKGGGATEQLSTENALDRLKNTVESSLREWSWT